MNAIFSTDAGKLWGVQNLNFPLTLFALCKHYKSLQTNTQRLPEN